MTTVAESCLMMKSRLRLACLAIALVLSLAAGLTAVTADKPSERHSTEAKAADPTTRLRDKIDRLPERQYDFRIDINSASWVEWTQIEGIGEVTANKIIADRDSNGPFRTIDDLLRVKGIGPKTLEKIRPFLREPNDPVAPQTANDCVSSVWSARRSAHIVPPQSVVGMRQAESFGSFVASRIRDERVARG